MYIQEKAHYVKASPLQACVLFRAAVHHIQFLPPALHPYKGYLGIVGADRATAAPGAVRGTVLWGRKQVMPLLLWPRLHKIHHRAVPGKAEAMEETQILCLANLLSERRAVWWRGEGRAHSPAGMHRQVLAHVSHQLWGPVGPNALGGPDLSRPGQPLVPDLGKQKGHEIPRGSKTTTISVVSRNANIHGIMTPPSPGNPAINPLN